MGARTNHSVALLFCWCVHLPTGDLVVCVFDSSSGELSIGINDSEPEVAIRGIEGTAYPAVVFYAGSREAAINSIACTKAGPGDAPAAPGQDID